MLIFRKKLMLERLKRENLLNLIDEKIINIMDQLDGKEVKKDDWDALLYDKITYFARTDAGEAYPINIEDVERVYKDINREECR